MTEQRPIAQIDELSHNQAVLTLTLERRELLASRGRIVELEQFARGQAVLIEQSKTRMEKLEAELADAKVMLEKSENTETEESVVASLGPE